MSRPERHRAGASCPFFEHQRRAGLFQFTGHFGGRKNRCDRLRVRE